MSRNVRIALIVARDRIAKINDLAANTCVRKESRLACRLHSGALRIKPDTETLLTESSVHINTAALQYQHTLLFPQHESQLL